MEDLMKPNAYFYWDENKRARFSPHDENIDVTSEQENTSRNKVKCFISSDYKFYSEALGKLVGQDIGTLI